MNPGRGPSHSLPEPCPQLRPGAPPAAPRGTAPAPAASGPAPLCLLVRGQPRPGTSTLRPRTAWEAAQQQFVNFPKTLRFFV